jgi:hypothetical protein
VEVRDFLYSQMRGARHPADVHPAAPGQSGVEAPESLAGILREVVTELHAIRQAVERNNPQP